MAGMGVYWGGSPVDRPQAALKIRAPTAWGGGRFGDPQGGDGFKDAHGSVTKAGGGTADCSGSGLRPFTACQEQGGHTLYDPHNPGIQICGGGHR